MRCWSRSGSPRQRDALVANGDYVAFERDERVNVIGLQDGWTRVGRSLSVTSVSTTRRCRGAMR